MVGNAKWLWPIAGSSFFDIKNANYLLHITWSKNLTKDYQKMSKEFFLAGYVICEEIVKSNHDNIKSDTWFIPVMYLFRQGLELGIKALICQVATNNEVQQAFINCKHDLFELYKEYELRKSGSSVLTEEENEWLKIYLKSIEDIDAKSDLFRFPFEDSFLEIYRNSFIDIVDTANSMLQAYGLIQKCLYIPDLERIELFDNERTASSLQFTTYGIGNCYLWESLHGDGFHKQILGYSLVAEYLFYECKDIDIEDKVFPVLFLQRNLIELGLKRMFYKRIEHGIPKKIFMSKRKSHLLYKELWKNARPMIEYYANAQGHDTTIIDTVEKQIQELSRIDKNGDMFRYPTGYSLDYRFDNVDIDIQNVYEFMQAIFNFCDGCDGEFEAVADWESEMLSEMNNYY